MSDDEKPIRTLVRHIKNVQDECSLLAERLLEQGKQELAVNLIANSMLHDNSKFRGVEWAFAGSGERTFYEAGSSDGEGFYGWEFREMDGLRVLYVEKWEDEPFRAGIATVVDPDSSRLVQT